MIASRVVWGIRSIFIISTFRDKHAERYYLRTHVFPGFEERLQERLQADTRASPPHETIVRQ